MTGTKTINAQDVYHFMNERNIVMSFVGDLTHEVVTTLLANIKKSISSLEADTAVKKKLYNVIVENLENIARHNIREEIGKFAGKTPPTIFIFSAGERHYKIITGNHVYNSSVPHLQERIQKVNSLDKTDLQKFYREKISEKETGGGLGIIDIAIKSGNKLSYEFKPVSENISFYILQTIVNK